MVRGAYVQRAFANRMTVVDALKRYPAEITPTERSLSQVDEKRYALILLEHFGKYSLTATAPEIIASFRNMRLAGEDRKNKQGKPCRVLLTRSGSAQLCRPSVRRRYQKNGASGFHLAQY
jgi:hypothetical protein